MSNNKTEEHKNKYVSYVPMSKNNTMTHMYRTILLALPALLLLAACADDVTTPAEPADTLAGQPVRFTATGLAITPAGVTQTKADADFTTMTVYMTDTDGNTWQADYTYNETNSTWQADDEPLYWPTSTDRYTFTAISPKGTDPHISLPATWTAEDLTKHEAIRATYEAEPTTPTEEAISLTLRPALTKVQVVSTSGQPVYLIDAPMAGTLDLTNSTTGNAATGIMTLCPKDDLTYEGYVLPAGEAAGFSFLTDNVYTVDTELTAGTVVTTCDMVGSAAIVCPEPGGLEDVWPESNPQKVVITGTLNDTDMSTINGHKDEITHLYVINGSRHGDDWKHLRMKNASKLQSVYLAEATSIGDFAFQECNALTSVSLPEATSIGNYAFTLCSKLTSVSLPEATSIGNYAFRECSELTSVSLPKNANIENNAFEACYKLTTLFLSNCPETEFDATEYNNNPNYGNHGWTTIHYGYIGTDGDYLKESNYAYHWPNN